MTVSVDERNRILTMVELGQVSASQAAQLLDAMETEYAPPPVPRQPNRTLRVRVTNLANNRQRAAVTATLPVSLIKVGLRLGTHLVPQLKNNALEDLMRSLDEGATGRLLDLQDMEEGERIEIFAE